MCGLQGGCRVYGATGREGKAGLWVGGGPEVQAGGAGGGEGGGHGARPVRPVGEGAKVPEVLLVRRPTTTSCTPYLEPYWDPCHDRAYGSKSSR